MKTELTASQITKEVLLQFSAKGWKVWRQNNLTYGNRKNIVKQSVPDVIGYTERGLWVACEVKKIGDKFSSGQIEFLRDLNNAGGLAYWATEEKGKVVIKQFEGDNGQSQKEYCAFPGCRQSIHRVGYCINHHKLYGEPEPPKVKKPIKKVSDKEQKRQNEYKKVRKEYLSQNLFCKAGFPGCTKLATDVHHMAGRLGDLLTDTENFLPVCRGCHSLIEVNPEAAKLAGLSKSRLNR